MKHHQGKKEKNGRGEEGNKHHPTNVHVPSDTLAALYLVDKQRRSIHHQSFLTSSPCDGGPPTILVPDRVESRTSRKRYCDAHGRAAIAGYPRYHPPFSSSSSLILAIHNPSTGSIVAPKQRLASDRNLDEGGYDHAYHISASRFPRYASIRDWLPSPRLSDLPSPQKNNCRMGSSDSLT